MDLWGVAIRTGGRPDSRRSKNQTGGSLNRSSLDQVAGRAGPPARGVGFAGVQDFFDLGHDGDPLSEWWVLERNDWSQSLVA